jgi:hypothetical protein
MYVVKHPFSILVMVFALPVVGAVKNKHGREDGIAAGTAILWSNPADIESRDLFYGPGGSSHVPRGPFTFVKEDLEGTNPKFVVKDADGVKWKVKLGIEARPETVASRFVWAVGYYANDDYFLADLQVHGMPTQLHRGQKLIGPDGSVHNARLKREASDGKKIGTWRWRQDAFTGTRELNGLRTLMAVLNNWDLKDENNAIYRDGDDERIYAISDLGASFGCAGRCWPRDRTKGDLEKYSQSAFIRRVTPTTVDFQTPARPRYVYLVNPKEYLSRVHLEWIGRNIPRADAKWMGGLLARLSQQQIHEAFRAAGYSPEEVDAFSTVIERRIAVLTDL